MIPPSSPQDSLFEYYWSQKYILVQNNLYFGRYWDGSATRWMLIVNARYGAPIIFHSKNSAMSEADRWSSGHNSTPVTLEEFEVLKVMVA